MGWEKYKARLFEHHTFAKFDCPDFWVDLRKIDSFPYGETKTFMGTGSPQALLADPELAAQAQRESEQVLIGCILAWNLTHPETGEPLPLPGKQIDDPEAPGEQIGSLEALPTEFIAQMHIWLQEDSELAKLAPKLTVT